MCIILQMTTELASTSQSSLPLRISFTVLSIQIQALQILLVPKNKLKTKNYIFEFNQPLTQYRNLDIVNFNFESICIFNNDYKYSHSSMFC